MIVGRDVTLVLGALPILERVSFTIGRGESVALVGPNGSGKTSLLRCLLGFVPFTGRLTLEGHDVVHEPIATRSLVGYVPQQAAFSDVRARDVLAFVAKLRRLDPGRIGAMLSLVGLADHAFDRVRTFSGGMRQRLALAVALLPDPPVLLFDEPTANLDRDGQELFHHLVTMLRRDGHTLVLASHRREEVAELTDRALQLDRGRLVLPQAQARRVIAFPSRGELR
jgi:ABC-type multidrug transport system ATPase subunit